MKNERYFFDTEYEQIISETELLQSFNELHDAGETECETFAEYVAACCHKNGTLEEIYSK